MFVAEMYKVWNWRAREAPQSLCIATEMTASEILIWRMGHDGASESLRRRSQMRVPPSILKPKGRRGDCPCLACLTVASI